MADGNDLIAFIEARLAEDEQAVAIDGPSPRPWVATIGPSGPQVRTGADDKPEWQREVNYQVWRCDDEADGCPESARTWIAEAEHIARHDPARVLREVEAKRRLVERYQRAIGAVEQGAIATYTRGQDSGYAEACLDALRDLANAWAEHPDYRAEWRPE